MGIGIGIMTVIGVSMIVDMRIVMIMVMDTIRG